MLNTRVWELRPTCDYKWMPECGPDGSVYPEVKAQPFHLWLFDLTRPLWFNDYRVLAIEVVSLVAMWLYRLRRL